MYHTTIVNPKTKRENRARAWLVNPRAVYDKLKSGEYKDARDISWALLGDDESIQDMRAEEYGDAAERNLALSIFENALDWGLGLAVLNYIRAFLQKKALPKPFEVLATRRGDVFIRSASGRLYVM